MTRIDFASIQTFCHATESEEKVLEALQKLYPFFEKKKAAGHFGNPILVLEAHLTRRREIDTLIKLLKGDVASQLVSDLERRMDEKGNIYIRLDKQALYRGNLVLKDSGEVKVTLHIQSYPSSAEGARDYAESLFSH